MCIIYINTTTALGIRTVVIPMVHRGGVVPGAHQYKKPTLIEAFPNYFKSTYLFFKKRKLKNTNRIIKMTTISTIVKTLIAYKRHSSWISRRVQIYYPLTF